LNQKEIHPIMRNTFLFVASAMPALLLAAESKPEQRLVEAATVLEEVMSIKEKSIPEDLLHKAHCIVIVPGLKKGAFIFGGKFGKGFISCRDKGLRGWSAPAAVRVEGGSVGFQIGGSESDVIMLVMTARGADKLLESQFTLGGEGEVAAGPVGRDATAQTDAKFQAEILSWSRSRGLFAGVSLQGATLRTDMDDNKSLYRERLNSKEAVMRKSAPASASKLLAMLNKYSPAEKK
jgi:SH3 domain-containing YSC84-like protein 1